MTSKDTARMRRHHGPLDRQKPLPGTLQLIHDEMMKPGMVHRNEMSASARGLSKALARPGARTDTRA